MRRYGIPPMIVVVALMAVPNCNWVRAQGNTQALPSLQVPPEVRLALPAPVSAVDLPIQRRDGKALAPADLHVTLLSVEGPGDLSVTSDLPRAVANGVIARLNVAPLPTMRLGSYAARLQVRDDTPGREAVQELVTLRIEVAPASLDAASLQPRTVTLLRATPFSSASGILHLSMRPTMAQSLPDLRADAGEVRRQAAQAGGDPTQRGAPDALARVDEAGPRNIQPGEAAPVTLHLESLGTVGDWRTDVTLRAQTMQPVSVPVTITVTDSWFFPTLAILIGVLCGLGLTAIRSDLRPRYAARQRLFGLTQRLEALAPAALDTGGNAYLALTGLRKRLTDAMQDLDLDGPPATADTAATKLDTDIDALAADLVTAAKVVLGAVTTPRQDLGALKALLGRLGADQFGPATTQEQTALGSAERALAAAEAFAVQQRCGSATSRLTAATQTMEALKRDLVQSRVTIGRAEPNDPIANPTVAALLDQAAAAVATHPITIAKLEEALDSLAAAHAALQGREGAAARLVARTPRRARPVPVITCTPESPVANAPATITVALPAGAVPEPVEWDFGDGRPSEQGPAQIRHSFDAAQVHLVTASWPDGTHAELSIAVGPSPATLGIVRQRKRLRQLDLALSAFAAVVATAVGLQQLYFSKVFGTPADYTVALLWGFGIDQTVRGVADAIAKVR